MCAARLIERASSQAGVSRSRWPAQKKRRRFYRTLRRFIFVRARAGPGRTAAGKSDERGVADRCGDSPVRADGRFIDSLERGRGRRDGGLRWRRENTKVLDDAAAAQPAGVRRLAAIFEFKCPGGLPWRAAQRSARVRVPSASGGHPIRSRSDRDGMGTRRHPG